MKYLRIVKIFALAGKLLASISFANAATRYELTITNGSQMPISPAAIYVKGGEAKTLVGQMPTTGFIQLCQTGNPMARLMELKADTTVKSAIQTNAPILPGESKSVEIEVADPLKQSIHFETMYGKTKDICGIGLVNSHSLVALKQHVTSEIMQKDNTVSTGAFTEPVLPAGMSYLDSSVCPTAMNAISCVRELSVPYNGKAQVRFFAGYFPSLITALEMKYGAADVQTLLFQTSGAIQIKLKLKH